MNKNELRAVMVSRGDTYEDLAAAIGCTKATVSQKINGQSGAGFTQPEIAAIKNRYGLTAEQVDLIFFTE